MYQAFRVVTSAEDANEPEGETALNEPVLKVSWARVHAQLDFDALLKKHVPGEPPSAIIWNSDGTGSLGDGAPMHYVVREVDGSAV